MIYVSWNTGCHRQKFSIFWANFVLSAPGNLENQNFNIEKNTWRRYHFTHLHHKWQSYDVWFLRYGAQQTHFFVILDSFLPFYPAMDPENQNFQKKKENQKTWRYYYFTKKNGSHIMYGSSNMECNGQNFLSFWAIFCPFTPQLPKKPNFWKNEKIAWRYYHVTQVCHKWQSYDVWFLRYEAWQTEFFVILDRFFLFYSLTTRKIKILKNWKKNLKISLFHTSVPETMIICYTVP